MKQRWYKQQHFPVDSFSNNLATIVKQRYPLYYVSRSQFALEAGVDERTIRRIENAEQKVSVEILSKVAVALNLKPNSLLRKCGL